MEKILTETKKICHQHPILYLKKEFTDKKNNSISVYDSNNGITTKQHNQKQHKHVTDKPGIIVFLTTCLLLHQHENCNCFISMLCYENTLSLYLHIVDSDLYVLTL